MTFGSLFAGIGGIDLGLERAGMTCVWQVECDPYCLRVLAKHWPDVRRYTDVRDVGAAELAGVDLIAGGFPCQDISVAGRGGGLGGERSGLWWEFARVIREVAPRYALVENVAALLGRGLDAVLGTLATLGYDAEWHCIPAAAVGAPHQRDRLFIVAYDPNALGQQLRGEGRGADACPPGAVQATASERQRVRADAGAVGGALADANGDGRQSRRAGDAAQGPRGRQPHRGGIGAAMAELLTTCRDQWATEPDVGRMADGVPARVDRLRGLGNAVVPQVAELIGRAIMAAESARAVTNA